MNRWVGIVSLRETPPPTPAHRIALAIEAARNRTSYQLADQTVPYARMRSALRTLGQEYARHPEWERYAYCVDLAGDIFDGGLPPTGLPSWLTNELQNLLDGSPAHRRLAGGGRRRLLGAPSSRTRRWCSVRIPWVCSSLTSMTRPAPYPPAKPVFAHAFGRAASAHASPPTLLARARRGRPVAVRMTEEFASAMVTVIPIVLVAASLEMTALTKNSRDNGRRRREAVLAAIRSGTPEPAGVSRRRKAASVLVLSGWYWSVILHVVAEVLLIRWLADSKRAADPQTAQFVQAVGIFGFVWVLIAGFIVTSVYNSERKLERRLWKDEIARERAARAAAVPEAAVPTPTDPGQAQQPYQ
ncbi:hypothetical protein [Streptomyces asiaticus]